MIWPSDLPRWMTALMSVIAAMACLSPLPAAAADVLILTSGAPAPKTVTIAVTDKVVWRNLGAARRSVAAEKNAFAAFQLEPEASHSQQFLQVGRFPYRVDGQYEGVVEVTAAQASGAPDSGDCGHPIIFHYDAVAYGYRQVELTVFPQVNYAGGVLRWVSEWTASWPDLPVGVARCRGKVRILVYTPGDSKLEKIVMMPGDMQASYDFSDTTPDDSNKNAPCQFHINFNVPGVERLEGRSDPSPGWAIFTWGTQPLDLTRPQSRQAPKFLTSAAFWEHCKNRRMRGAYGGTEGSLNSAGFRLPPVNGLDFNISDFVLTINFPKGRQMAYPLEALAGGIGFNVDSGSQVINEFKHSNDEQIVRDRVVVSFSPRK